MAEVTKPLYIVVVDDKAKTEGGGGNGSFRYTRSVLQTTLQLMGCKPRHAFKISRRVFEVMRAECFGLSSREDLKVYPMKEDTCCSDACLDRANESEHTAPGSNGRGQSRHFEIYKRRTTMIVRRKTFLDVVCDALGEYKYVGPNQRADLVLACRIRERKQSVTVLLCGTSGCGKSTLSALLGNRLGITTVISTDSIRHMMRSFVDEKENPLLWASTYHAGEYLDPLAVSEAKAKRKAKKLAGILHHSSAKDDENSYNEQDRTEGNTIDLISPKQMAIEGFKAQSEMVIDSLDRLITSWEERRESVVVEGVHLGLNFVMGLMKKHPSIIPFMVYISNEEKHLERFAVRAKYMTLDPAKNKYVKYIRNIRTIQEFLCNRADKHGVPKINNTNVDRSVAAIHATVFSSLRRYDAGEQLYDPITNTVAVVAEEYKNQCTANSLSSKGMFQLIQRKGSSRHLMALVNTDGSVAKAWPVNSMNYAGESVEGHVIDRGMVTSMYGPLQIGKAEPVNLQFGYFGISAWPSDTGGTSHASSIDESRGDLTDNGSRHHSFHSSYHSSCCSSPRFSDCPSKELKEEHSVHGSDEEADDPPEIDSDEDASDQDRQRIHEEMEGGSVDEVSDEEYDDLDNGYLSDYDQDEYKEDDLIFVSQDQKANALNEVDENKYHQNLNLFVKIKKSEPLPEPPLQHQTFTPGEKNERRMSSPGYAKMRRRSQSIPAFRKRGALIKAGASISGAPPPR